MAEPSFSVEDPQSLGRSPEGPLAVIGRPALLSDPDFLACLPGVLTAQLPALVAQLTPSDPHAATATLWAGDPPRRVDLAVLPERASRHNTPARSDAIERCVRELLAAATPGVRSRPLRVLVGCQSADDALAASLAVARALPRYSRKSGSPACAGIRLAVHCQDGPAPPHPVLQTLAGAVRDAAAWVDTPASELHATAFVSQATELAEALGVHCQVLAGEQLRSAGFGGLWNVGRAATHPPALVVLSHLPETAPAQPAVALVGKGIVYDTGGLSLKRNSEMLGMKGDMAGAAAVLAAFSAAVRLGASTPLHAVLCVAENAVGPDAMRPDDVLTLYSGKTVEVRNTDCEGRLVLADGVAYAARQLAPTRIIDLATLTDGAVVATGRRHAALVCNDAELEAQAVAAGRAVGELVHPLPYCPELHRWELRSEVADLSNAARDPDNANAACAAQFIEAHLEGFSGGWLHVDLEGPGRADNGRGTGFGVGLLLRLLGVV